ncbi:MAG: GxxExxY protein [Phycisphaerales bacterium]|nr:GxxExxY protein [Phycisphaerales bacterium]
MGNEIGLECERLTEQIIGAAIRVHQTLGPGLLENTYEACLCHELAKLRLGVQRQVAMPVLYDGISLDCGYRLDLLVEDTVVVELKAVDKLNRVHEAQLITYLKLGQLPVGLLINFNTRLLKDGIVRRANTQATLRELRDLRGSNGVSQ